MKQAVAFVGPTCLPFVCEAAVYCELAPSRRCPSPIAKADARSRPVAHQRVRLFHAAVEDFLARVDGGLAWNSCGSPTCGRLYPASSLAREHLLQGSSPASSAWLAHAVQIGLAHSGTCFRPSHAAICQRWCVDVLIGHRNVHVPSKRRGYGDDRHDLSSSKGSQTFGSLYHFCNTLATIFFPNGAASPFTAREFYIFFRNSHSDVTPSSPCSCESTFHGVQALLKRP